LKRYSSNSLEQNKEWSQIIDYSLITLFRMFRLFRQCSEFSFNVQNVQNLMRYWSECSDISDNVQTLFSQCLECSESVQNVRSMFRMFRICSDFFRISSTKTGIFRISWLCSDSNQQCHECDAFVVKRTNTVVTLDKLVFSPYTPITATITANKNDN
jgi:hypothetical protein